MNLDNKVAIVTGSGRGIGKAIAKKLASLGANVVINDIESSTAADETAAELGTIAIKGDVRSTEDVARLIEKTIEKFGRIDIIINNAGITRDGLLMKMDEKAWDDVLDINLKGAFNVIKAVSRQMIKQKSGKIVNISSVVGVMGNAGQVNYSASKAGLIGLTKSVAKEFASKNINCNAVAPGFIESDMTDKLSEEVKDQYLKNIPLKRLGTPDEIADVVAFLVADESKYITGQVLHIDGGLVM